MRGLHEFRKLMRHSAQARFGHELSHVLVALVISSTVLLSIILASCSSRSLSSIYLISMFYQKEPPVTSTGSLASSISDSISKVAGASTGVEVRVGYFSLCITVGSGQWECGSNAQDLQVRFLDLDPLNMITMASGFRNKSIFPAFLIAQMILHCVVFVALVAFPTWHDEDAKETALSSQSFALTAQVGGGAAALFGFMSALWQHSAAVTVETLITSMTYGNIASRVGKAAMAIGWLTYFLPMFVFAAIVFIRVPINRSKGNSD